MEEQARLSQLACDGESLQWSADRWPKLMGGCRQGHASIVVGEENKESIIVLGGYTQNGSTNSVFVMNTTDKKFRQGPFMSEGRCFFAARKVNIFVYACGGVRQKETFLNTIERIDVNDLLETPKTSTIGKWKTLPCRLTTPRGGCTACDVMNRYLVIVGGNNGSTYLSSVDILDTGRDGNNHTIVAGADMNCVRCTATSEVIGTRMFVVGGREHMEEWLRSVEYVEFGGHNNSGNVSVVFQRNYCWTLDYDLALSPGRGRSAMAKIGKCMIVADGSSSSAAVEVLDTDRHVVWSLPSMTVPRRCCSMVALSKSIVIISGQHEDSVESLSIHLSQREQLKAKCNNRAELEAEIDKLTTAIHRASVETTSVQILQDGAEAEDLIPILKSLRSDDKFLTADEIQEQSNELTLELERVHSAKERIPIVKQINKLKELLAQSCGKTSKNDKPSAQYGAPLANLALVPSPDSFYAKLVEANNDPIIVKVHELSALVFHVHHVKVFYTFLNHLFRSGLISLEHRQCYTAKALNRITKTITNAPKEEREIVTTILEKAVKDCALSETHLEEIKQNNEMAQSPKQLNHEIDIRHHIAAMQFRVGNVRVLPIEAIKSPTSSSSRVEDKTNKKNFILPEFQVLGWSLNQLQTAYRNGCCHEEVAVAAICSILNACRFGANVVQDATRKRLNNTDKPIAPPSLILPRVVDFGDIHHVGHVVEQSGVLTAQRALAEGIALVDEAIAAAEQNEATASLVANSIQQLQTGPSSSSDILVSVMGKFANAVSQWYKKHDGNCGSNEDVTILALAVTAKLVQASETRMTITTDDSSNIDSNVFDVSKDKDQKDKEHVLFRLRDIQYPATSSSVAASSCHIPALDVPTNKQLSILARLERLEQLAAGNSVLIVQRLSALEHNYGLNVAAGAEMDVVDRLSQLEKLLLKDSLEG